MRDERDEMLDRIVNELKTLPAVPADATARVLARVDAARHGNGPSVSATDDDDDVIFFPASTEEMRLRCPHRDAQCLRDLGMFISLDIVEHEYRPSTGWQQRDG